MIKNDDEDGWRRYKQGVKPLRRGGGGTAEKPSAVQPERLLSAPVCSPASMESAKEKTKPAPASSRRGVDDGGYDARDHVEDPFWRRRWQCGAVTPEARLDLHHMTEEAAYAAVTRFVRQARERRLRILLIITGRGDVLRPVLPLWLRSCSLNHCIRWIFQAAACHGGAGAYYVVLRSS